MTPEDIQDVLQRLAALAGGWKAAGAVPPIERDLVLDKLRQLYEALLSGTVVPGTPAVPAGSGPAAPEPVSISLDEVLSIGLVSEPAGPEQDAASAAESVPEPDAPASEGGAVPEAAPPATPAAAREKESGAAENSVPGTQAAHPQPAGEPVALPGREDTGAATQPGSGPVEDAVSPAGARSQTPSQPVFPTLFGLEDTEERRRRRHKQQVLMSLYDDEPRPAVRAAVAPEPVAGERPVRVGDSVLPSPEPPDRTGPSAHREAPEPAVQADIPVPAGQRAGLAEEGRDVTEERAFVAEGDGIVIGETDLPAADTFSDNPEAGVPESVPAPASAPCELPEPESETRPEPVETTILGEVINRDVQTLADTLAASHARVPETVGAGPVTDLRQAIGLNDRFLLVRDLFGGDAGACDRAVEALNGCADLDDCMIYIAEHYAWNPHSDGSKRMMELLERKFS